MKNIHNKNIEIEINRRNNDFWLHFRFLTATFESDFLKDFNKQKAEFFRKHEINAIMMLKLTSVLVYLQTSCWVTIFQVEKKHSSVQAGNSRSTPRFKCPPPPPFLRRAEVETVSQIKDDIKLNFKEEK